MCVALRNRANPSALSEVVGSSPKGLDAAIRAAIERASKTVRHLDWFHVTEIRGRIEDGGISQYQVALKQVEALNALGNGQGKQTIIVPAAAIEAFGEAFRMFRGRA